MAPAETINNMDTAPTVVPLPEMKPLMTILKESCLLYMAHWRSFTARLLFPILLNLVGLIIAIWGPIRILNYLQHQNLYDPVLMVVGVLLVFVPGMYFFTRGFWEYLVYMVSLNQNAAEVLRQESVDFKRSYEDVMRKANPFTNLLLVFMGIWIIPFACVLIPQLATMLAPSSANLSLLVLGGILLGGVLSIVVAIMSVYFSLSFQLVAFEPVALNPWKTLKRSYQLVDGSFGRVLVIILTLYILTNALLPGVVGLLFDITQLTGIFTKIAVEGMVTEVIENVMPASGLQEGSILHTLDSLLKSHIHEISIEFFHLTLYSLVTVLLLPLGTFAFTLLYADLIARKTSSDG